MNDSTDAAFQLRLEEYAREWAPMADEAERRRLGFEDFEIYVLVQESHRKERLESAK